MAGKDRGAGKVVHIGKILGGVLESCRTESDTQLLEVWRLWDSAVGSAIAANTRPAAFKGRLLLVHTSSSAWIHQLQFLKAELIGKLNAALGRDLVSDIKFKIGPVEPPGKGR